MPKGNALSRLLIVSLAAAAIAAPAATAQPLEPMGPLQDEATVLQDARGEAVKSQTRTPAGPVSQDMRTEAAKDPSRAPETKALPGPPTWPMHPRALTPPQATVTDDGDGGGVDAPLVALIIAGALALGGGMAVVSLRHRTGVAH
jgi:hypothetical protein